MTFQTIVFDGGGVLQCLAWSGDGYLYMGTDTQGSARTTRDGTTGMYGQQCILRNRGQGPQNSWHQFAGIFVPQHDPSGVGNVVLGAVGNDGSNGGVLRSTDRMDSWSMLSKTPQFSGNTFHVPGGVQANPQRGGRRIFVENSSFLFVGTTNQGVMRSGDHGATWPVIANMASLAPSSSYYCRALTSDPATPTTLYAGFADRGGTTNFGGLWKCANANAAAPAVPNFIQQSGLPTGSTVEDITVADGWVYAVLGTGGLWVASTASTNSWTQIGGTGALDPTSWWSSIDVINDGSGNHLIAIACSQNPVKKTGDDNYRSVVKFVRNITTGAISSTVQMTNLNAQLDVGRIQTVGGTRTWWNSGTGEVLGGLRMICPHVRWDPDPAHLGDLYISASQGLYRWSAARTSSVFQLCSNVIPQFLGHAITACSWGIMFTGSDFGTIIDTNVGAENASFLNAANPINSSEAYAVAVSEDETVQYSSCTATNQKYTTIAGDVFSAPAPDTTPTWTALGLATAVDSATSTAEGHKTAQGLCALNNGSGQKTLIAATPNTGIWYQNASGTWSIATAPGDTVCKGGSGNLVNFAHVKASQYVYVFDQADGIWRSNNYGAGGSWVKVFSVTNSNNLCGTIAAHPTRVGEIWFTTQAGLFKITGAHTGTVGSGATKTGPISTGVGSDVAGPCGISDTGYVYCCTLDTGAGSGLAISPDGLHWQNGDPTGSLAFIASRPENMAFIPHVGTTAPVCCISNGNTVAFGSPESIATGPGTSGAFTERQQSQNFTGTNSTTSSSPVGAICNIGLPTAAITTHQQAADYFDNVLGTQYRFGYTAQKVYFQNANNGPGGSLGTGVYPQAFVDGSGRDVTPIVNGGAIIYLCYQMNPTTSPAEDANFVASVQWWANNHPQGANGVVVIPLQEPQNSSWKVGNATTTWTQSTYASYFAHYCPLAQAVTDSLGHHVKVAYDGAGHSVGSGACASWLSAIIALGCIPDIGMVDFYGSTWETLTSGGTTNLTPLAPFITICNTNGMAFGYGEIGRAEGSNAYTPSLFPQYIGYIQSSLLSATKRDAVMWYNGNSNSPNQNTLDVGSDMIAPLQQLWNALMAAGSLSMFYNAATPPSGGYPSLLNSSLFAEVVTNDCAMTVWANDGNWQLVSDAKPGSSTGQPRSQIWAYLNAPAGLYGDSSHLAIFSYSNPSATVKGKLYEETIPAGYAAAVDETGNAGAIASVASPATFSVTNSAAQQYSGGLVRGVFTAWSASPIFGTTSWAPGTGVSGDGVANTVALPFNCVRGVSGSTTQSASDVFTYASGTMVGWAGALATFYCVPGAGTPLSITTTTLPHGAEGTAFSQTIGTNGGIPPTSVGLTSGSPAVPAGLTLDTTGLLHGTPSIGSAGTYNLVFQATDSATPTANVATQAITLVIDAALQLTGNVMPDAQENSPYSQDISGGATGGVPPYTFGTTFSLPSALVLETDGTVDGTPALGTSGTINFPVTVTDAQSHTATGVFTLTIQPAVPVVFPPPGGSTEPITATLMDENLNVIVPINFATLTAQLFYNFVGAWSMTIPFDDSFWQVVKKFLTVDPTTGVITQNGLCTVEINWQGLFSFGGKVEVPGYSFTTNQQAGTGTTSGPVTQPGPLITLGGADYLALVANRIAFPDPTKSWPGQTATGKKTYGPAPLENVLKSLIGDNLGAGAAPARQMALLDIDIPQGAGGSVTYDVKFAQGVDLNLMDIVRTLVGTGGPMGVQIVRNGQRLLFKTYVPTDRTSTAYFSPDIGNLTSVQLSLQDPTVTTVLTQSGIAPLFFFTNATPNPETDWSRIEVYNDQTGQTNATQAQQSATDVLSQGQSSPSLSMTATDIPLLTFGRDYFLGDIVSVEPRPGDVYSDLVSSVLLNCDATQQPSISVVPTIGYSSDPGSIDPTFTAQLLKRVQRLERRLNAQIG